MPARKGWSGSRRSAQGLHTRCGCCCWNLGGSSSCLLEQDWQKMPPHSRQWCRDFLKGLHTAAN